MKKGIQKVLVMLLALSMIFSTMALPAYADDTAPGEGTTAGERAVLSDGTYTIPRLSTAVLSMYHFDSTAARVVVKGDNAWLITSIDGVAEANTLKRFDGMAYGPQSQILDAADETNHTLVAGTPVANVIEIYGDDGETVVGRTFVLPVPKSVFENGEDIYYMLKYRAGYNTSHDGDWYKASGGDYYLTGYTLEKESDSTVLPGEETPVEEDADYTAVDAAIAAANAVDRDKYTESSLTAMDEAVAAVVRGKKAGEQAEVDAMAAAINAAIEALELKQAEKPETIELEIENEQGMFKAVSASLETYPDGSRVLVFALSGTGYIGMYKGIYPEAVQDKDAIVAALEAGESTEKTIVYKTNEDGKYEFRIPLDEEQTYIPLISVSKRGFDNRATKPIENNGFYARQAVLQDDCTKMWLGDYDETTTFTLSTELPDFKADPAVSTNIKGGPVNNNYSVAPVITMLDATYDSVTYPSVVSDAVGTKTAALEGGKFILNMENAPNKKAFQDKTPLTFTFHVAEDAPYEEAGTDVVRTVTFDQIAKTITVEGTALTPKKESPSFTAGQYIVGVKSIKLGTGANYTMFVPRYNGVNNTALVTVAEDGTATIFFDNNRNTYNAIFLGEPDNLNQEPTEEQKASASYIVTKTAGTAAPYEFEFAFNTEDLGKTVPYVTVSKSSGKFNKDQLAFVFDDSMTSKAAFEVVQMIDALPAVADVTIRDKDAIEAARAAYEALTAEQKAQVTNLDKLVAAEEAFAALPEKDEATVAVETAMGNLIQQYTDVNETTAAAVAAVRADYDALSPQQKAYIDDTALFKLNRAEACVAFVNDEGVKVGNIYDAAVDTSDNSPFIAATMETRQNAAYIYLYSVTGEYTGANLVSSTGKVSKSTQKSFDHVMRGLWMINTDEGQGRPFVVQLTGPNGASDEYSVKVPSVYGTMAEGTYEVKAIQTPSSKMRKFERSTITSDGTAMTVEFVMPNTTYGKIYLGTQEEAEAATEGFIEPTGTEATSGTTGEGNVYSIPLESMYMPITISYCNTSKNTWTQETVEFVVDEPSQAMIDAVAALGLDTYFNVTADQRDQVALADGLHQALNDNQKAIVENANYSVLKKTVAMFATADKVAAQIEALPAAEAITEDDTVQVREVKNAYDNMGKDPELMEVLSGNGLQNTQLEKLISQELRDKLNACTAAVPADYTAVDAALETVPADLSNYTEETAKAVTDAVAAVDRTKKLSEQKAVDAMAAAINDAVTALELKPADYTAVDAALAVVPEDLSIYTEDTTAALTAAMNAVDRTKKITEQADVDAMAKAINDAVAALEKKPANYSAVEAAKAAVPEDLSIYTEETVKAVTDAVAAVVEGKKIDEQEAVDAMAKAIEDAVAALEKKPADYSAVESAKAKVPADMSIYTEATAKAVTDAIAAVEEGKKIDEQAAVDNMAKAIEDAVKALEKKPADYSAVDAAKAKVPANLSIYTDSTRKAVEDALAAAVDGKKIDEQADVDAMANAIDDAVAKLQLKPADYSKVDAAIAKVPKDMSKYTDASVQAVNDALKAVVRGKMANEQAAVDNMAKAINDAVAGLKVKKGWVSEDGSWYFYDNSGNMVKNSWAKDSVGWCYLGADGRMTRNAWVTDSHGWCWIGADGYWATGSRWISCNGSWYYISNGYMVANAWQRDSVGWCYLGSDGKMVTNGWASDSHGWCWLGSNGYWTSSTWVLDDGEWYYIKPNHYMAANEWARDSVGWMYMAANGKVTRSQWIKDGGYWYYLKADGYMATGTLRIGSKTYTFASSGRWVK